MPRLPKYALHKATGQARVCIDGRDRYLGPYGSEESKAEYARLIEAWKLRQKAGRLAALTVGEIVLLYEQFAQGYYRKNGKPTTEVGAIKSALRHLVKLHRRTPAVEFGPRDLKAVRAEMLKAVKPVRRKGGSKAEESEPAYCRYSVNKHVSRIVRMFKWAVSEEYCTAETHHALLTVGGLRKGRTEAHDPGPIQPVDAPSKPSFGGFSSC